MKLIKEITEEVNCFVTEEAETKKKNYFVEGIIMQGDVKNKNGRIYPSAVLVKESNRYTKNYIEAKKAYGELGHPNGPQINLDRVSHMFTELRQEGANIVGKAKIIDTPMGRIVKNLIDEGANLGISSRGLGSVKQNSDGIMEVQKDFMLATAGDIVADPSGPDCYVRGIMENREWYFDVATNTWTDAEPQIEVAEEVVEKHIKEIDENYSRLTEEQKLYMFNEFLTSIRRKT